MSFLAGRLASTEGAYFLQESKQAVTRILEKNTKSVAQAVSESNPHHVEVSSSADVLPEVLKHYLPSEIFHSDHSNSSISRASKWVMKPDPISRTGSTVSPDAINPLRGYVSLPQVTFGPKRWQLPNSENTVLASTANDLRQDKHHTTISAEKLKAAASGLSLIGSALAVATAIVFGGGAIVFGLVASKLNMHNTDDIRTKGRDIVQPKFDSVREKLGPLRTWSEELSKKLHVERQESVREKPLIKELSRTLGTKNSMSEHLLVSQL